MIAPEKRNEESHSAAHALIYNTCTSTPMKAPMDASVNGKPEHCSAHIADDLHEDIVRLEAEIEELTGVLERSRKLGLIAKLAISFGAAWLLVCAVGAISSHPVALISALAAVIGGIVLFGSNASTSKEAARNIRAAETRRAELIDRINLRLVGRPES